MTAPPVEAPAAPVVDTGAPTGAPVDVSAPATPPAPVVPPPEAAPSADPPAVEYQLTLPADAVLDAASLDRTIAFARASGLSPEAAQQALVFANTEVATAVEASRSAWLAAYQPGDPAKNVAPGAEWTKMHDGWLAASLADPALGAGDQAKLDAVVASAQQAYARFATPAFTQLLERTGYGSHPEVLRVFANIAAADKEAPPVVSNGQSTPDAERESLYRMYPSMRPKD